MVTQSQRLEEISRLEDGSTAQVVPAAEVESGLRRQEPASLWEVGEENQGRPLGEDPVCPEAHGGKPQDADLKHHM